MLCTQYFALIVCYLGIHVSAQTVSLNASVLPTNGSFVNTTKTDNNTVTTNNTFTTKITTQAPVVTADQCLGKKSWSDDLVDVLCSTLSCATDKFNAFSLFMTCNEKILKSEATEWNEIAERVYDYASVVATTFRSTSPSSILGNGSVTFATNHFLVEIGFLNRERSDLRLHSIVPNYLSGKVSSFTGKKDSFKFAMLTLNPGVTAYCIVLYKNLVSTTKLMQFNTEKPSIVIKLESLGVYKWPTTRSGKWVLNSQVARIGFTPSPSAMTEPIDITFFHIELIKRINHDCIALSGNIDNTRAVWSTSGCRRIVTDRFKTVCRCDSPGVFAVISQIEEVIAPSDGFTRTSITMVAVALSIFAICGLLCSIFYPIVKGLSLDLLVLTYLDLGMTNEENFNGSSSGPGSSTGGDDHGDRNESFWQSKCPSFVHELNDYWHLVRVQIYVFHDFAAFMVYFLFIIGVIVSNNVQYADTVAGCIHFFQTAVISWVIVEGIHNYHMLNPVYDPEVTSALFFYNTIGWGIPAALSGSCAGYPYNLMSAEFSWIKLSGIGYVYFLVGPFSSAIIILVMYLLIFYELRSWIGSKRDYEYRKCIEYYKKNSLVFVVGLLTWYSGVMARNHTDNLFYTYLFLGTYGSQGASLIYLHFLRNTEIAEFRSKLHSNKKQHESNEGEDVLKNAEDLSSLRSSLGSSVTLRSKATNRKNLSRPESSRSGELYAETKFGGDESGYIDKSPRYSRSDSSSDSSSDEDGAEKAPSSKGVEFSVYQIDEEEGRASTRMSEDGKSYNQTVSGKLSTKAEVYVQQAHEEESDVHVGDDDVGNDSKVGVQEKMEVVGENENVSAREIDDDIIDEEVKEKYERQERDEENGKEMEINDSGDVAAEYNDEEKEGDLE